ncbi:MAG TPA: hypothetical protein VGS80_26265 [Ktedonobacterales bacterium]|nr:hypothetical protein [Ktedonobacterales bacterium]
MPIPAQIAEEATPPHRPRPYARPTPPADEWDFLVAQTRAALEEEGLPEETIQHAIARIRDRQRGNEGSMERHHIAEHTNSSYGDQSGSPRRRRTLPSGK